MTEPIARPSYSFLMFLGKRPSETFIEHSFHWKTEGEIETWAMWQNPASDEVFITDELKASCPDFMHRFPWHMKLVRDYPEKNAEIWRRGALKEK